MHITAAGSEAGPPTPGLHLSGSLRCEEDNAGEGIEVRPVRREHHIG